MNMTLESENSRLRAKNTELLKKIERLEAEVAAAVQCGIEDLETKRALRAEVERLREERDKATEAALRWAWSRSTSAWGLTQDVFVAYGKDALRGEVEKS